ncbi:MAG: hypothetical protein U0R44_05015 [Candidatus Micrarchaeia archaeon]
MALTGRITLGVFLTMLLAASAVFADVGPAPAAPAVVVHLENGGKPETSISEITYHCLGSDSDDEGAVTKRLALLSCSGGDCTNSGEWFYKFNPCFKFPGGHFTYKYGSQLIRSVDFNFSGEFKNYELTVDAPSGQIPAKSGSSLPAGCPGAASIILAITFFTVRN